MRGNWIWAAMPELAPGLHGKHALYVDGNDFFAVPNLSVSKETLPKVTFGCWVRPISSPGKILGQREGGASHRSLNIGLDGVPFLSLDSSGNRALEMPAGLEMGHWYMVAATFDAVSGTLALYVDGDMVQSNLDASFLTHTTENGNISDEDSFVVGSGGFVGYVDDFFVYAGVLSLGELNAIHFAANDGPPFPTLLPPSAGPAGYALHLQEGTYFDAGFLPERVIGGPMSISVWLKPDTTDMGGTRRYAADDDVLLFELGYYASEAPWSREVWLRN